ncbi:hypothetical protein L209DRAFT_755588 [Thermothelomyces heterothallicus CBS 203.75]
MIERYAVPEQVAHRILIVFGLLVLRNAAFLFITLSSVPWPGVSGKSFSPMTMGQPGRLLSKKKEESRKSTKKIS